MRGIEALASKARPGPAAFRRSAQPRLQFGELALTPSNLAATAVCLADEVTRQKAPAETFGRRAEKEPGEFFVPHSEAADSQVLLASWKPWVWTGRWSFTTKSSVCLPTGATKESNSLIDEGAIDPNCAMVVFYNGWDRNIGRWYFPHKTSYPYEKLIYVITRAYINETKDIMNSASHYWAPTDMRSASPDIFTLVFLHYVMNYTSKMPMEVPGPTGCGTPMDDFMEAMKNNITREMKRLSMHSSTARYRIFYLAPVDTKWYRLKHIETWSRQNDTFSRSVLLTEVEAYLRNRTLYVVMLESVIPAAGEPHECRCSTRRVQLDRTVRHAEQEGGVHLPVGTSARLVVGTWWLYVVIVMAYYSSNLIAFLTVPEPRWLVSSFREVARREDVHIYVPYGTGVEQEIWVRFTSAMRQV
ncbi:hypothetical protein HPB48_015895 [Haemaphysalis longicornis]|uniref:Ionotropic glutamate receptor C-terminal domain-containing protein n=1 Tax=Haemaphysalis longicornis TaxID=44386 RepID=A0A9J6GUW6_HAELO|nr:hypothetical protein HPB48_015895 [Haemaphysalis longicornis]